jgi:hypothetical protein
LLVVCSGWSRRHHFVERISLGDEISHTLADINDHVAKLHKLPAADYVNPVARDHLCIWASEIDRQVKSLYCSSQRTAIVDVDDRIACGAKDVAKVKHIGLGEVHKGVAVSVRGRRQEYPDLFTIEVERDAIFVRNKGARFDRCLWKETAVANLECNYL